MRSSVDTDRAVHQNRLRFRLRQARTNSPIGANCVGSTARSRHVGVIDLTNRNLRQYSGDLRTRLYFERVRYGIRLPAIIAQSVVPCRSCRGWVRRQLGDESTHQQAVELRTPDTRHGRP